MLCLLMVSVAVSRKNIRRIYFLQLAILGVSLIGIAGDAMGYDMVSLLPFQMPDDAFFDQVTMDQSGAQRIRGFMPESGVLGAVCLSVATLGALSGLVLHHGMRRHTPVTLVWIPIAAAGLLILGTTLTKSGVTMLATGLAGFFFILLIGRNPACRMMAVVGIIGTVIAAAGFVLFMPGDLGAYMRSELVTAVSLQEQTGAGGGTGLATRVESWKLALCTLYTYPSGVGEFGIESVLNRCPQVVPTPEMNFFFAREMYGLKSALANLIAETGFVGLGLLGYWLANGFLRPALTHLRTGTENSTFLAGLYGASAFIAVGFLFSCELYPSLALLLVFKMNADAVAYALRPQPLVFAPVPETETAPTASLPNPDLTPA
jgi:hypothetical protein